MRRRRGRNSLLDFTKAIEVPGKPVSASEDEWLFHPVETGLAAHHLYILQIIEQVVLGKLPRAMFFLPPGSAKSTYGSVVSPAWIMGKMPGTKIILASYGSDLARRHGRRARQVVKSNHYKALFGTKLASDTAAADEWALTNGSEYIACGVLSGITGHRANGIIIDDPIKGRQEADSETVRQRTWDVYLEDLRTRLVPGGWEIIIQTRWHEDDLAGRILPEKYAGESGLIRCRDGRDWYVVCLPAQCERLDDPIGRKIGEYLWPEWFSEAHFAPFKTNFRTWTALFQQKPQPEEGTFFQRSWFKRFRLGEQPVYLHIYGSSDYAVSEEKQNDETEHGIIGVDPDGDLWVLDWWHGRETSDKWIDKQLEMAKKYKPFCWFGESGVIKKAINPFLIRSQQEKKVYFRTEWIPTVADKPSRARGFQGRAAQGKVHLPVGEEGDRLIDQFIRFPTAKHDDAVDTFSTFCMALEQAHPAIVPFKEEQKGQAHRHIDMVENTVQQDQSFEAFAMREQAQDRQFWNHLAEQERRDINTHDLDGY